MPDPTDNSGGDEPGRIRPLADVLRELDRGRVHDQASTMLRDLIAAVADTGRKGTLTLTIALKPMKAEGRVTATAAVSVKAPAPEPRESIFFIDDEHNLVRDDPHQPYLPLQDVSATTRSPEARTR